MIHAENRTNLRARPGGLRDSILQQQFKIGLQFFSPKMVQEVTFVLKGKPALRLISVGAAQFRVSWNQDIRSRGGEIKFQSQQFEKLPMNFSRCPNPTRPLRGICADDTVA